MSLHRVSSVGWALSIMLLQACSTSAPDTEIVRTVRAAGAEDLERASEDSLRQWFSQHQDIAASIREPCTAASKQATATWGDSTEGRVCKAALIMSSAGSFDKRHRMVFPSAPAAN